MFGNLHGSLKELLNLEVYFKGLIYWILLPFSFFCATYVKKLTCASPKSLPRINKQELEHGFSASALLTFMAR